MTQKVFQDIKKILFFYFCQYTKKINNFHHTSEGAQSSENHLTNSNGEQSDDHEEPECSVHPESQSSKIIFNTKSSATKYKVESNTTNNMKHFFDESGEDFLKSETQSSRCSKDHINDVCCKGSEYSVHPAKAFYYSSINAKSVGSKIKVYNDALTKVNQYFSEQVENPKRSGKQSIYTVSNLEKGQFSDQFSKKDKLPVKHKT